MTWWRSSFCTAAQECVEVAQAGGTMFVRGSTDSRGVVLGVPTLGWMAFTCSIRDGVFSS